LLPVRKRRRKIGCRLGHAEHERDRLELGDDDEAARSAAFTTLPGSTSRKPTWPVIGAVIRQ
jgi:hypothetical protein